MCGIRKNYFWNVVGVWDRSTVNIVNMHYLYWIHSRMVLTFIPDHWFHQRLLTLKPFRLFSPLSTAALHARAEYLVGRKNNCSEDVLSRQQAGKVFMKIRLVRRRYTCFVVGILLSTFLFPRHCWCFHHQLECRGWLFKLISIYFPAWLLVKTPTMAV